MTAGLGCERAAAATERCGWFEARAKIGELAMGRGSNAEHDALPTAQGRATKRWLLSISSETGHFSVIAGRPLPLADVPAADGSQPCSAT
jgi:hypothetical protein